MIKHNIEFIKGDSHNFYFSLPISKIQKLDKLYYTVKESIDGKVLMRKTLIDKILPFYDDEERNHFVMIFEATDTDEFETNKNYYHEIEGIKGAGKQTLMQGFLRLNDEITLTKNEI